MNNKFGKDTPQTSRSLTVGSKRSLYFVPNLSNRFLSKRKKDNENNGGEWVVITLESRQDVGA